MSPCRPELPARLGRSNGCSAPDSCRKTRGAIGKGITRAAKCGWNAISVLQHLRGILNIEMQALDLGRSSCYSLKQKA